MQKQSTRIKSVHTETGDGSHIIPILYRISNAVSTTHDLDHLFAEIHDILKTHIDATNFFIATIDEDEDRLQFPYYRDEVEPDYSAILNISNPKTTSFSLQVLRSGEPLLLKEAEIIEKGLKVVGAPAKVWLGVPLKLENQSIGVMAVQHYQNPDHYTQDDVRLMMSVSEQIALAIERKTNEKALQQSENIKTIFYKISKAVGSTRHLTELFSAIHDILKEFIDARNFLIALVDDQEDRLNFPYFEDEMDASPQTMVEISDWHKSSPTLEVLRSGKLLKLDKKTRLEAAEHGKFQHAQGSLAEIWIGVPLIVKDKVIGVMVMQDYRDAEHFSKEDTNILDSISKHVAVAIERKINEDALRASENINSILYRISNTASTTNDLDELYQSIHSILMEQIDATNFSIALINTEKDRLDFPYYKDEATPKPCEITNISDPATNSLTLHVVRTNRPLLETAQGLRKRGLLGIGARAQVWLGVPLRIRGQVIGAMVVQHHQNPDHYTEQDINLMVSVSETVASSIERIRAQEQLALNAHQAGMAEMAVSVLHNIGNAINSVNVRASLLKDKTLARELRSLIKIQAMMRSPEFFSGEPEARPALADALHQFLAATTAAIEQSNAELQEDIVFIRRGIEHIMEIITIQQRYAGLKGFEAKIDLNVLVEDALEMLNDSLSSRNVTVVRQLSPLPQLSLDKNRTIQILINVIKNAYESLDSMIPQAPREIIISTTFVDNGADGMVRLKVTDNGIGLDPDTLKEVFKFNFSTKGRGTGFGLHDAANYLKAQGGTVQLHSKGSGCGAQLAIELPTSGEVHQ